MPKSNIAQPLAVIAAAAFLSTTLLASNAWAVPELGIMLSEPGYTAISKTTISDSLTLNQPYGTFNTTITTGYFGSSPANLDLDSLDVASSSTGGTLILTLSRTDVSSPIGAADWLTSLSGHFIYPTDSGTRFSMSSYVDDSDELYGKGTLLSSLGPLSGFDPPSSSDIATATNRGPFALTLVLVFTGDTSSILSADGSVTTLSSGSTGGMTGGITGVSEPDSVALLATGLVGLFGFGFSRRSRTPFDDH